MRRFLNFHEVPLFIWPPLYMGQRIKKGLQKNKTTHETLTAVSSQILPNILRLSDRVFFSAPSLSFRFQRLPFVEVIFNCTNERQMLVRRFVIMKHT